MAFSVPLSAAPLQAGTLPALKTRHFSSAGPKARIYTMARLYLLQGDLMLDLCAFERTPAPESYITFAAGGSGPHFFQLRLAPQEALLSLCPQGRALALYGPPAGQALDAPVPARYAGSDEQGWYWAAGVRIPAAVLATAGIAMQGGAGFQAALFKHQGNAVGASVPFADYSAPTFSQFGRFIFDA